MVGDAEIAASQDRFLRRSGDRNERHVHSDGAGPDERHAFANRSVSWRESSRSIIPFMFAAGKAAAPLAAGNTVVVKPPEQAPLSALRLAELVARRLSAGRIQRDHRQRTRNGRRAGRASVPLPKLRSSAASRRGAPSCAAQPIRSSRYCSSLGGKNALIAFPDADPAAVADAMIAGMNFAWCGQSCGSTSRAFVHAAIHDRVLQEVRARHWRVPTRAGRRTGIPPWARSSTARNTTACWLYIASARQEGATLVCGGGPPAAPHLAGGLYIEPTVFADVRPDMTIAREETFGPVLSGR